MSKDLLAPLLIGLIIFFIIGQLILPLIYDVAATDKDIRVLVFGVIPVMKIPYTEMSNIAFVSYWQTFTCLNLPNRILGITKLVLVERRKGVFKKICITPRNPEIFMQSVRIHTEKTNQRA